MQPLRPGASSVEGRILEVSAGVVRQTRSLIRKPMMREGEASGAVDAGVSRDECTDVSWC